MPVMDTTKTPEIFYRIHQSNYLLMRVNAPMSEKGQTHVITLKSENKNSLFHQIQKLWMRKCLYAV